MKKLFILLVSFFPFLSFAHVKWFVDVDETVDKFHSSTPFYSWGSKEVLIWSAIVLVTVFIFAVIDRIAKTPKKILAFGLRNEKTINRISQAVLGIFLITVSFIWQIILVPDLKVDNSLEYILQAVQIILGLMFVFNIKPRIASIGLILLLVAVSIDKGLMTFLENIILLSLALYFFIVNSKDDSYFAKYKKHSVEIVRIGTGISLIVLAFTEKLMYPELSMQFLDVHHWNFMQSIFPWFTNKLFVLSTGFAEMIFGILFIFGYITRVTTILIAIFFAMSVTTMLIQFKQWEVEDLQVYAAAILFIFYGHGKTKFFHFILPDTILHTPIIFRKKQQ